MALHNQTSLSDRQVAPTANPALRLLTLGLLLALAAGLGLRTWLPADALAPAAATLIFALAAATACAALLLRRAGRPTAWLDVAGVLTLVGVAVTTLIEPEQMIRLVASPESLD